MRIAVTTCDGRISPVFEAGKVVLLVDLEGGREVRRSLQAIGGESPTHRIQRLVEMEVDVLICGGITSSFAEMLHAVGIGVVDQVRGTVDEALQRYRTTSCGQGTPPRKQA